MKTYSDTDRKRAAVMRATVRVAMLTAVFLVALAWTGVVRSVYAEPLPEKTVTKDSIIGLEVRKNGETIKEFTQKELEQIAKDEGNKTYTYSAWNTFPTFDIKSYSDVRGPTVDAVLRAAGVRNEVPDTGTVSFSDGSYGASFTGSQLFKEKRYCFPNGGLVDPLNGTVPPESYEDASEIEAVIYLSGGKDGNVLCIGQAAPNEENKPAFVKGGYIQSIIDEGEKKQPIFDDESLVPVSLIIEVKTAAAPKCTLPEAEPADKSVCGSGQEIILRGTGRSMEYIYYTLDGSEPDYGSAIYNSGMNQGLETRPVLPKKGGKYTVKVKVKAYGRQDSETAAYTYYVAPGKPSVKLTAGKRKVTVSWKKVSGASGYVVYRSAKKSSGFRAVRTIKKGSTVRYTNTKLKKGRRYYYKVRAYMTVNGKKVYGRYSAVKSIRAK